MLYLLCSEVVWYRGPSDGSSGGAPRRGVRVHHLPRLRHQGHPHLPAAQAATYAAGRTAQRPSHCSSKYNRKNCNFNLTIIYCSILPTMLPAPRWPAGVTCPAAAAPVVTEAVPPDSRLRPRRVADSAPSAHPPRWAGPGLTQRPLPVSPRRVARHSRQRRAHPSQQAAPTVSSDLIFI